VTQDPISEYRLNIDTDIGYHPILYPILTPISVVAVADIGHPDIGPDINTDIGYLVYDIGKKWPDIGVYPISVSISVSM
jgi:hypothetical protein